MDKTGDVFYSMAMTDGSFVGGMYEQPEDQRQAGIPPHWLIHIAVDDVDAIAARVPGLGGTVAAPPFDIFDAGRMTIISDPTRRARRVLAGQTAHRRRCEVRAGRDHLV